MKIVVLYLFIGIILWFFTLSIKEKESFFIKVRGFFNLILFWPLSCVLLLIMANEARKWK